MRLNARHVEASIGKLQLRLEPGAPVTPSGTDASHDEELIREEFLGRNSSEITEVYSELRNKFKASIYKEADLEVVKAAFL